MLHSTFRTAWTLGQRGGDALRYNPQLRHAKGLMHLLRSRLSRTTSRHLHQLCSAVPLLLDGEVKARAMERIRPHLDGPSASVWRESQIGWERYAEHLKKDSHVSRTLMLKAPAANGEKGVIVTHFEYNFVRLLNGIASFKELTDRYTVIYTTSWSPTNYHVLAALIAETTGSVWIQASNFGDVASLSKMHSRVRCLETLAACDWLAPEYFPIRPDQERDIDLLVVSNWAPFKRHWVLFEALRNLPREWKVVLVGQPETGHSLADIQSLQKRFEVPQQIEYHERLTIDEVTALQLRSKVGAVFSRHEGGCVAATEALMAGASLALIDGARIGALAHVNETTGVALRESHLAEDLRRAVSEAKSRQPRAFAEKHVSCHESSRKLNEALKREAEAEGRPWTQDIETCAWRPYPRLMNEGALEKLQTAADALATCWPNVFAHNFQVTACR